MATLDSTMELEEVYWHFFVKFKGLGIPRSVAEARISENELQILREWFARQYGKPRNWCDRTWQEKVEGDYTASSREMFGALFLIVASEFSRDHCSEDSLWPIIAEGFRTNKTTYAILFANNHPTELCKVAMAAGVRKLRLRNLIDRSGKQEYFDTIKLQIGFTYQGALQRLPDWLDGLGDTTAVRILSGVGSDTNDLKSESTSFQRLWTTLRDLRAGQTSSIVASQLLQDSPWIRASWVKPLLEVAKQHKLRSQSAPTDDDKRISGELVEPTFSWDAGAKPRFQLKLNDERINDLLSGKSTAVFAVDGAVVDRWSLESTGEFRGSRLLPCEKTGQPSNLRPQNLSVSSNGEPVESVDLSDLGLDDPIVLFGLASGAKLDPHSTLDTNRDYALICDTDLVVKNVPFYKAKNRSVYRLVRPLSPEVLVLYGDDVVWEPQLSERKVQQPLRVMLEAPSNATVEVGAMSPLIAVGIPEDAVTVKLVVDAATQYFVNTAGVWTTSQPILMSVELSTGNQRLRLRIDGPNYRRTILPKLSVNMTGIAILQAATGNVRELNWKIPKNGRVNRAAGDGWARIFDSAEFKLREGPRLIDTKRSKTIELRDLAGWGAPLCADFNGRAETTLARVVEDKGCFELYMPAIFGRGSHIVYLRRPMLPSRQHTIYIWQDIDSVPTVITGDKVRSDTDGFEWSFTHSRIISLMAISYEGVCLGAYWNPDYVAALLTRPIEAETIAILRWLKVPILAEAFHELIKRYVKQYPSRFLKGWLDTQSLRAPFLHRQAEGGLHTVVRSLFWNYSERRSKQLYELVPSLLCGYSYEPNAPPVETFRKTLLLLGEVCPSFAYSIARANAHDDRYRMAVLKVIQDALGLNGEDAREVQTALREATRECAKLVYLKTEDLAKTVEHYEAHLAGQEQGFTDDGLVNRLAEYTRGREFLIGSLLMHCFERSA